MTIELTTDSSLSSSTFYYARDGPAPPHVAACMGRCAESSIDKCP